MPDVRFWVWAIGHRFRAEKYKLITENPYYSEPAAIEIGLDSMPMPSSDKILPQASDHSSSLATRSSSVGFMLEGYYDVLRRAVAVALLTKATGVVVVGWWAVHKYRQVDIKHMDQMMGQKSIASSTWLVNV